MTTTQHLITWAIIAQIASMGYISLQYHTRQKRRRNRQQILRDRYF